MQYTKPELVVQGSAADVILGGKGSPGQVDGSHPTTYQTQFAYEADE